VANGSPDCIYPSPRVNPIPAHRSSDRDALRAPQPVTPELLVLLQQVVGGLTGGSGPGGVLPFQFPSLQHLDERMAAVTQRAIDVEGLSQKSVRSYRSAHRQFRAYLLETKTDRSFLDGQLPVQRRVLEGWVGWLRGRGVNHTTVNTYWRALHAPIARIARQEGMLDPTRFVETPKPGKSLPKFLSRPALEDVFRFVRNYQWRGGEFERLRNVALIAVMALGGCRLGEVLHMEIDEVDCGLKTIRIKRGKGPRGGKPRVICMPDPLAAAMATYLMARAQRGLATPNVFVAVAGDQPIAEITIRRLCAFITRSTKIKVAPHLLRHTCATLMRQAGIADRLSMEQLGHSRLDVLQRYSHVVPGERQEALAHFTFDITGEGETVEDAAVIVPADLHGAVTAGITDTPSQTARPDRVTPS
jgi:site-specific recombinase XerD